MRMTCCFPTGLSLALMCTSAAFGQAMIEYGHGVAKAAAAGAASGTGIVGVFTKLKGTAEDKDTKNRAYSTTVPAAKANAVTASGSSDANGPLKMTTSSGVVISGVAPTWLGASYNDVAGEPVRVRQVEWANAEEDKTARLEREAAASMAASLGAPEGSGEATRTSVADDVAPATVVGGAEVSTDAPAVTPVEEVRPAPTTDAETAGIRLGAPIADVIQLLGRPSFALTGIAGKNYSEKYVFRKDVGTISVLCWGGVVNSVSVRE